MSLTRFRIRTIMIAVALAALLLAGTVALRRFWEPRVEVIDRGNGTVTILHSHVTVTHVWISPWGVVLAASVVIVALGWASRRRK